MEFFVLAMVVVGRLRSIRGSVETAWSRHRDWGSIRGQSPRLRPCVVVELHVVEDKEIGGGLGPSAERENGRGGS